MIELPRTSIIASPLYMPVLENNEVVNFQPVTPKAGEYVALIFRKGFVSTNILLTKGSLYGKEKGLFADFDPVSLEALITEEYINKQSYKHFFNDYGINCSDNLLLELPEIACVYKVNPEGSFKIALAEKKGNNKTPLVKFSERTKFALNY